MNTAQTAVAQRALQAAKKCNPTELAKPYSELYGGQLVCFVAIDPFKESPLRVFTTRGSNTKGIAGWLARYIGVRNVYFTANPVSSTLQVKPSEADICRIEYCHVDLDPLPNESAKDARKRWSAALHAFEIKPYAIWPTGNGYQALFKNKFPYDVKDRGDIALAKSFNIELQNRFGGKEKGADRTQDICRLMRAFGTPNIPDVKKLSKGRTVELAGEMELLLGTVHLFDCEHDHYSSRSSAQADAYQPEPYNSLDDLGLDRRTLEIIQNGRLQKPKANDDSRSAWEFDAVLSMLRAGLSPGLILAVVTDPENEISEGALERTDPLADIRRTIAKAQQIVSAETVSAEDDFDAPLDEPYFYDDAATESEEPAKKRNPFKARTFREIERLKPPAWLVDQIIAEGCLALIYGLPKSGKTYLVGTMGLCLATGTPFNGRSLRKGRVLHIVAEGSPALFANRVRAFITVTAGTSKTEKQRLERDLNENWRIVSVPVHIDVESKVDELLVQNTGKYDLIIIDTLLRNMSQDTNDAKDMNSFVAGCDKIRRKTGAAVVIIHHEGKTQGRGALGSIAITAAVDMIGHVECDKTGRRTFEIKDSRDTDGSEGNIAFELQSIPVGSDGDGKISSAAVVRFVESTRASSDANIDDKILAFIHEHRPGSQVALGKAFSIVSRQKVSAIVNKLRDEGLLMPGPKVLKLTAAGLQHLQAENNSEFVRPQGSDNSRTNPDKTY